MTPPVLDADDAAQFDVLRVACELELNHRLRVRKDKFGVKSSIGKLWTSIVSHVLGVSDDKARERHRKTLRRKTTHCEAIAQEE